jgi:hypothetical protein
MKRAILLLFAFLITLSMNLNNLSQSADQDMSAKLGNTLRIDHFIIGGVDVAREGTGTFQLVSTSVITPTEYELTLSPVQVVIGTNLPNGTPLTVTPTFDSFLSPAYTFPAGDFRLSPTGSTTVPVTDPYATTSGNFNPIITTRPGIPLGDYTGTITFTVVPQA